MRPARQIFLFLISLPTATSLRPEPGGGNALRHRGNDPSVLNPSMQRLMNAGNEYVRIAAEIVRPQDGSDSITLHELATNAVKDDALSNEDDHVRLA